MEAEQKNIEEEYDQLKPKDNNSNHRMRKVNSEKKMINGILKRERTRKTSNFCKNDKEKQTKTNNGIKWDDLSIKEQNDYRKNHPLDKEKLKGSLSRYTSSVIVNDDDVYIKGLNKVNQINPNDEIINRILDALKVNTVIKKDLKRNKSCLMIGKYRKVFNLKQFYLITEKEKIFDESLGEEQKLTLKNTLFNKINTRVEGKQVNIS
jgi:hypothetical protein